MADDISDVPAGLVGVMSAGWASYFFHSSGGLSTTGQFWAVVPYWMIAVVLGYLQWFVAVPKLWQTSRRAGKGNKTVKQIKQT